MPTTPMRRKQYGRGMIVDIDQSQEYPITVVFPAKEDFFQFCHFTADGLDIVNYTNEQYDPIMLAADNYHQLMGELKHV